MTEPPSLAELRREHFEPLIGDMFTVPLAEGFELLVLEAIEDYPNEAGRKRAPFSLILRGQTPGLMLHQQIQPIGHPALGYHEWFVVPYQRNGDGTHNYEVAFT